MPYDRSHDMYHIPCFLYHNINFRKWMLYSVTDSFCIFKILIWCVHAFKVINIWLYSECIFLKYSGYIPGIFLVFWTKSKYLVFTRYIPCTIFLGFPDVTCFFYGIFCAYFADVCGCVALCAYFFVYCLFLAYFLVYFLACIWYCAKVSQAIMHCFGKWVIDMHI